MSSLLSQILLGVYRAARGTPSPIFKRVVLDLVREHLPFDSAVWGTFVHTPQGARIHTGYLFHQPPEMRENYDRIAQHDDLNLATVMNPGVTIRAAIEDYEGKAHPLILDHMSRFGIERALATSREEPVLKLWSAVAIYRRRENPLFTEAERTLKEELMPHLVEAWHLNAFQFLDRDSGAVPSVRRARALLDAEGFVYNAEPGFADLLRLEFPGWEGPQAPESIARSAIGDEHLGKGAVISSVRSMPDGLRLFEARDASTIDQLSPRERTVALSFAKGFTYREIAADLAVSPATVRNQLRSAYTKLGVSTKLELAERITGR